MANQQPNQGSFAFDPETGKIVSGKPGATSTGTVTADPAAIIAQFGIPNLPPELAQEMVTIFERTPNDPQGAFQNALQYLRGSDWYATNYAGIQQGIASGVINNEGDYRTYMNQANQMYQQFYGRQVTTDDMQQLLSQGIDLPQLSKQLDAGAKLAANGQANPGVAALFGQDELQQIANTEAGLGSQDGQFLQGLYQYASQVAPLYAQYGVKINRAQIEKNYTNGVPAETIARQFAGSAFADANRNDIQTAVGVGGNTGKLTDQQLTAYGNEQAGLDTPLGQRIQNIVDHASRTMQGLFQGHLTAPGLTVGPTGRVSASTLGGRQNPDVAA